MVGNELVEAAEARAVDDGSGAVEGNAEGDAAGLGFTVWGDVGVVERRGETVAPGQESFVVV